MSPRWVVGAGLALTAWGLAWANPLVVLPGMLIATLSALAWLWSANILGGVSCRLELDRTLARPGETITGTLTVDNDQPFPVPWLDCSLEWPQAIGIATGGQLSGHHRPGRATNRQQLSLRWFERVSRPFTAVCHRRGEYVFGPVSLAVADPFGLYADVKEPPGATQRLIVIPRTVPVLVRRQRAVRPFGDETRPSWLWEDPAHIRGAREYLPGDPFSRLEWRATARTGRLHTRLADATLATEVNLVVNVSTGHALWQGLDEDLLERTIVVAASLTREAIAAGRRLALYSNGLVRHVAGSAALAPGSGPAHLAAALRLLGRIHQWPREPYRAILARAIAATGPTAEIWLVTPVWDDGLAALVKAAAGRPGGRRLTVVLTGCDRPAATAIAGLRIPILAVAEGGAWDQLAQITLSPSR